MQFLKKVKEAGAPERSIKYLLYSHLNGPEKARPLSRMHASELTKPEACVRACMRSRTSRRSSRRTAG